MSLTTYRKKRDFNRTPEPKGKAARKAGGELRFVVQKHDASHLHYDFRLELDGTLKSWAVPKGPSLDPARKNLAVQVEDHPIDYGDFEGVIPKGEYGGGTVLLWDKGTWEPLHDPSEGFKQGKLHFVLHGTKLKGEWSLVQMHGRQGSDGKNWLLMKLKDKHADAKTDVLEKSPNSVKTRRSLQRIAKERKNVWSGDAKSMAELPSAHPAAMPTSLSPQLAVLATHPPSGPEWLHEIKFDGYRIVAFVKSGEVTLRTRNGLDWTARFPGIASALAGLKVDSAVLDGEAVVLDDKGRSDFQALQAMLKNKTKVQPVLYVFDLLFCNGSDLRETPLLERKKLLAEVFSKSTLDPRVRMSDHVMGDGSAIIDKACDMSLEGIISKRVDSPYQSRRVPTWLKSKCDHRQEFAIVGYTDPQGSRLGFGALLLGYHDDQGELVYAGRVGTGFDDKLLGNMHGKLSLLEQKPATVNLPKGVRSSDVHWVKPELVCEVRFTGWTQDGVLRHPAFIALRLDKPASEIVREQAVEPKEADKVSKGRKTARSPGTPGEGRGEGGSEHQMPTKPRGAGPKHERVWKSNAAKAESQAQISSTSKEAGSEHRPLSKSKLAKADIEHQSHATSKIALTPALSRRTGRGSRKAAPAAPPSSNGDIVAGVKLTHPDKILYPETQTTKHDVAEYYQTVAEWMLPHVIDRPLALVRCPEGRSGKCFFQRNWSSTLPSSVDQVDVSDGKKKETHVGVHDISGVVALAQIGVLEVHTWNCRSKNVEKPDQLLFDLDPGPDLKWDRVVEAAELLHDTLTKLSLPVYLKTSGGKGLHLTIPIEPNIGWDEAKSFCEAIAKDLVSQSDLFVANMRKDLRGGKVYVDYHRNGRGATAVAPYSTRAREGAPVSMPISWKELGKLTSAAQFTVESGRRYLEKRKTDPWNDFEQSRVDLRKIVDQKSAA